MPGVAGDGVAEGGEDVVAVFADGGDVTADAEPVGGAVGGAVAAGDLHLGFRGAEVSFGSVVGERDLCVVDEPEDLRFVGLEALQQQ